MANLTNCGPHAVPVGETMVCVFHRATAAGQKGEPLQQRGLGYLHDSTQMQLMSLKEFLRLGMEYGAEIIRIRSATDKEERSRLKRTTIPTGCLSCRISTKAAGIRKEEKILEYNSIIVLDFDDIRDVELAKKELAVIPYIWYVGLSVSGGGVTVNRVGADPVKINDTCIGVFVIAFAAALVFRCRLLVGGCETGQCKHFARFLHPQLQRSDEESGGVDKGGVNHAE